MKSKQLLLRIICLLIAFTLCIGLFAGCEKDEEAVEKDDEVTLTDEERFDKMMDEMFADWVSDDSLSMNYFLANPEAMGIERPEATFGEVITPELIQQAKEETKEISDFIDSIQYESLRSDQKVVYEILERSIALSDVLERKEDYSYYIGYIRPLNGLQVQLPILLAEFNFYTVDDIDRYLDLLGDTMRYFNDIIEFERERSRRGFFMSEANVDSVIEQVESYLEDRENNLLITVFNDRIDNYEGLSSEQREQYKQRNTEQVLGNVLPAYDNLLEAMKELRGVGARQDGIATLPDGSEYAHAYLRLRVGTDRSVKDLEDLLEQWVNEIWMDIMGTLYSNEQIFEKLINDELGQIAEGTPKTFISALQKSIAADFPPIDTTNLTVLEVHESLQEHTSPAFYLAPAVDRFNDNVVYINPSDIDDNLFLFTVLAHESYPGHMYQTVYFLQQSPHPVRVTLSNTGYSEGWATYSEMRSYFLTTLDDVEAGLMWNFRLFDLLIQSYVDYGVNVLGWNIGDVRRVLSDFNITDSTVVESIFNMVTGVPLNSLYYSIGYIEMLTMLEEAQRAMGSNFKLLDFHRYILDFGSAPYPIISAHMNAEIMADPSTALAPAA